jgi:hypothetical protein
VHDDGERLQVTGHANIPFLLDAERLMEKYRIKPASDHAAAFVDLVARVQELGRPKAVYTVVYIDEKGDDWVVAGGVRFTSLVLRKNLDQADQLFPYVVTCGTEVDAALTPEGGVLEKAWLYILKGELVGSAVGELTKHIGKHHQITQLSSMNPGSGDLDMWPLSQQKELFSLLGDVEKEIGLKLTGSCLLMPEMSVSGVMFPTETDFQSCQVCHRERCPNRRAPFSQELWDALNTGADGVG